MSEKPKVEIMNAHISGDLEMLKKSPMYKAICADERAKLREGAADRVCSAMNHGNNFVRFIHGELTIKEVSDIAVATIFDKEG